MGNESGGRAASYVAKGRPRASCERRRPWRTSSRTEAAGRGGAGAETADAGTAVVMSPWTKSRVRWRGQAGTDAANEETRLK